MSALSAPRLGLALVVVTYIVIYGAFLLWTHGLPYVLDNNESFSSLWHAYNLVHFDIAKSMGLADETFAYHAAAHPVVHTHQGNFPRLFAALIFVLGATSAQSQIVVTTFTVGLAGVVLAYVFFTRIADPLLAVLFCLILMTDYILVGQWQVVTYRVWHLFFVFSSLLCVHLLDRHRRLGTVLTLLNFACLFYYELVFVFFVSLSTAIYAALYLRGRWRAVATFWAGQAAGAAVAVGVLLTQLTLYMGWADVMKDFRFTFMGRNYLADAQDMVASAVDFYGRNNIAFWYNLGDAGDFRTIRYFIGSLTYFELQLHTPFFTLLCGVLLLGLAGGMLIRVAAPLGALAEQLQRARVLGVLRMLTWIAFAGLCYALGQAALTDDLVLGVAGSIRQALALSPTAIALPVAVGVGIWVLLARTQRAGAEWLKQLPPATSTDLRWMWTCGLLCAITALVVISPHLYGQSYSAVWREVAGAAFGRPGVLLAFFAVVIASVGLATGGLPPEARSRCSHALHGLLPFWGAALLAYAVTFYLSPAYIFSGYRYRAAPFTVFHTTAIAALACYPLALGALRLLPSRCQSGPASESASRLFPWICAVALAAVTGYWLVVQAVHVRLLPPRHYDFLRMLSEPPFKGGTFVVNGYAAPIAAATGNWAFLDDNLVRNVLVIAVGSRELTFDSKYLWFADRRSNPAYRRPEYFACIAPQSLYAIAQEAQRRAGSDTGWKHGCETHQLVMAARGVTPKRFNPGLELVAFDKDGPAVVGYERWAIVRLHWDDAAGDR
jgi:hypothetical protein